MRNDSWYDPPEDADDDGLMEDVSWVVEYDTVPSPGAQYYHGWRLIMAYNETHARDGVRKQIARNFPEYGRNAIEHVRILKCYQSTKLPQENSEEE